MSKRPLTYAGLSYFDQTLALESGEVEPEGISLNYVRVATVGDFFFRQARFAIYEASEFSLSTLISLVSAGDSRFVGVPIFPSRQFRHRHIYIRTDAGIAGPDDLRGKRVGVLEYGMTAAVWVRGFLRHDYGVSPSEIRWFTGGLRTPVFHERLEGARPKGVDVTPIGERDTLEGMFEGGELDALVSPVPPIAYGQADTIVRLFADSRAVELEYFRRTKLFPIMHTVVMRREIYEENPWMPLSLMKAFRKSRDIGTQRLRYTGSLAVGLPWLADAIDDVDCHFGGDAYPDGVAENAPELDAIVSYAYEQGLAARRLEPTDLFARETIDPPMTI